MPAAASAAARRTAGSRPAIQWHRVGRLALLVTLAAIVLLYIPPVTHWIEQRRTAAHGKAEMQSLQRENDMLRGRMRQLTGPDALEREARRLGMVRRGERPYVVDPSR